MRQGTPNLRWFASYAATQSRVVELSVDTFLGRWSGDCGMQRFATVLEELDACLDRNVLSGRSDGQHPPREVFGI